MHALLDIRQTKDNPVGDEGANGDDGTLEADEETTVVRFGALRLPHGNGGRVHAVSNAGNDTTDNELAQTPMRAKGRRGDNGADNKNRRAHQDQTRTAKALTKEHGEQRAKEATDFIAGRDSTANNIDVPGDRIRRVFRHGQAAKRLGELSASNQTRHHTLVVTKERETHDSCEGDEHPERSSGHSGRCRPHVGGMGQKDTDGKRVKLLHALEQRGSRGSYIDPVFNSVFLTPP